MRTRLHLRLTCALVAIGVASSAHGYSIDTIAGRGVGDKKLATRAGLLRPTGVSVQGNAVLIGDSGHGRIRRVKANGKISTFAGTFPGTFGDFGPPGVAGLKGPLKPRVAPNGDVIVAEFNSHVVRRISGGTVFTVAGEADTPGFSGDNGPATAARLRAPADAFQDAAGNIYIADAQNHRIRKIDPGGEITTIAGTGTAGAGGDGGPATQAQLNNPVCIVPGPAGSLYVCDSGNHMIRRISAGGIIRRVAGTGTAGFTDNRNAKRARLNSPADVTFALDGDIIIADLGNQRVRRIDVQAAKPKISTIAGNGTEGYTGNNVPAASPLGDPSGVAVLPDGRILIAEASNNRVRVLSGGTLRNFAGDGVGTFGGDGKPALRAQFDTIHGVTVDNQGRILIGDQGENDRIRRIDANGIVTTIAGNGSSAFSGDGGQALQAGMTVSDLVVDGAGNIIFSDTDNHRVRRITPGGIISTIAGTGTPGFSGDNGPATAAMLRRPTGVALDDDGNLYISDFENNRIRRVAAATGVITTVAGNGTAGYNGDDRTATSASLNNPTDVAFDAAGNMYIADFRNHRVRLVSGGQITTFAGTGTAGDNSDGPITPTSMQLDEPTDVQVDAAGNVFIVDSANNKIRRVAPGAGGATTIAGSGFVGLRDRNNARQGRMSLPLRIHLNADGSMLVADNWNFVVRIVEP